MDANAAPFKTVGKKRGRSVRDFGCGMLERENPLPGDGDVTFEERTHTYSHVPTGREFPVSVTGLIQQAKPPEARFDGLAVIKRNLAKWRASSTSEYARMVKGLDDEEATEVILRSWEVTRNLGSTLHGILERAMNSISPTSQERVAFPELAQLDRLRQVHCGLRPLRAEFCVYAMNNAGLPAVAGCIDLVACDSSGRIVLIDWKRTPKSLSADAPHFRRVWFDGAPLNDHFVYSLQLTLYGILFERMTNLPVHRLCICQLHRSLREGALIDATHMREEALMLLRDVDCKSVVVE
jgi:ATP-dependent exoDNAse (exonuclease V) beta subunit